MKRKLLLIATGGTIASKKTADGLSPAINSQELIEYVPEIKDYCDISAYNMFNLDSTNMCPEHWLQIADKIKELYEEYDGFIVSHGTDTMAYASAMLYYLVQNSTKPIVLTGAQRSIYERDSDARENLLDAVIYASDDGACGVHIVFGGKVISGTRARKTHTRSYNAFSSIDYPDIAVIRGRRLHYYIRESFTEGVKFYNSLDSKVIVIKLIPGMNSDIFRYVAENYSAVIIESFGMGGLPYYENDSFSEKIDLLQKKNVRVVMTTQVPHEGSDMSVYKVGLKIKKKYELAEAYDMTTEAVSAKVMWALSLAKSNDEFKELFLKPVGDDII